MLKQVQKVCGKNVDEAQIVTVGERYIIPQFYRTIKLDVEGMKNFLSEAPLEFSDETRSKLVILYLPMPDGSMQKFSIVESPIMAPELAAKYPEIKTYLGKGIDDPYASVRFDFTMHRISRNDIYHLMEMYLLIHIVLGDIENYISYYTRDYTNQLKSFECEVFSDESSIK